MFTPKEGFTPDRCRIGANNQAKSHEHCVNYVTVLQTNTDLRSINYNQFKESDLPIFRDFTDFVINKYWSLPLRVLKLHNE